MSRFRRPIRSRKDKRGICEGKRAFTRELSFTLKSRALRFERLEERRVFATGVDPTELFGFPQHPVFLNTAEGESGVTTSSFESGEPRLAQRIALTPNVPFQNPVLRLDVNNDDAIAPIDALVVINWLNSRGPGLLADISVSPGEQPPYLNTNGDEWVAPIDVLPVINWLNNKKSLAANDGFLMIRNASDMILSVMDNDILVDSDLGAHIGSVNESAEGASISIVNGTQLLYTPPADFAGTDTFTYSLSTNGAANVFGIVTISVTATNNSPVSVDPLSDIDVDEDAPTQIVDLSHAFSDADALLGDRLNISIQNENQELLTSALNGNQLSLTFLPNRTGAAEIAVIATDLKGDTATRRFTVTVTPINDAPSGADSVITTDEDTEYLFSGVDFEFSDLLDLPGNNLVGVRIIKLPETGALNLSGSAVNAGDTITQSDIAAGKFSFLPASESHGGPYATFQFQVQDDGGIENGGIDLDPVPKIITINVNSINDTPSHISLSSTALSEDAGLGFTVGHFSVEDADAGDSATLSLASGAGDDDNAAFTIDGLQLKTAASLDFETQSTYHIRVRATDSGGLSVEREFVIDIANENEAPITIALSADSVTENVAVGTVIGQLSASDPDSGDTATFTLVAGAGDEDNAAFAIDADQLKTAVPLDFETQSVYHLRVQATDAGGLSVERTLTVHLTDENEAPTDMALSSNSVSEHAAVGTVIGQLSAIDADANDSATFTLVAGVGDEDNAAFTIEDDQLKTAVPLDFETQSTYHLRVRVTDAGGLSVERSFTIEVLDEANEAPTDILLSSNIVLENSEVGTTVGSLTSIDPNLGDTATFSLVAGAGGEDNASFTIEGEELKTAASLDFEAQSTYHIRVRATDSGGLSVEREFVIDIANENEAPTTIALSADSITENVAVGTVIGQLTVSDPDSGDTATFTLVAGAGDEDNAAFAIDADQLKTAVPLDFETQSVYHLRVQATDAGGLSVERTLTVHLTDENEAPTDMALSSNSVSEHAAVGTVIGQLSAIDADANDSATFTLVVGAGDEDNTAFTIEGEELKTAAPLDFETQSTYHVRVRATDAGGLSVERAFTIDILDEENERPTDILLSPAIVLENSEVGTTVGSLTSVDPNLGDTATFSLIAGAGGDDNASFTIEGEELKTATPLDFETQSTYHIRVRATDSGGLSVEREFVIDVANENEAPITIALSADSVTENVAVGTVIGQLTVSDPDSGDTATFTLVAGAGDEDNAAFAIDADQLKTAVPLDFETQSVYHIRVQATDAGGLSVERSFTIDVLDETNEAPTDILLSSNIVLENSEVATTVGSLTSVEPNLGDTATFSLIAGAGGDDNASFTIEGEELKTATPLDFETQSTYHIRVRATDSGGLSVEREFVIDVANENEAPTTIALSADSVTENMAVGTVIGQLTVSDPDSGDTATFTLVAGAGDEDNAAFAIDADQLKTAVPLDFETQSVYHIRVQATDAGGLSVERTLTVHLTDENEAPTDMALSSNSVSEHAAVGTVIGQLSAIDADANDSATFTLVAGAGDEDNIAFTIEGEELKTAAPLDFETQSTYHVRVRATDAGGLSVERAFTIDILDEENERPTDILLSPAIVLENSEVGTTVGSLTSVDPNLGDTATFSLIAGAGGDDNASFTIEGEELKTAASLDFETQSTYHIRVRATDSGGLSVEREFVIDVANENEAPITIALSADSVAENVAVGTVIGQLTVSDPDSGDTATFTLVSGAGDDDNASFAIDADQLKTAVPLDFETQSVYHLRVQATDAGGLSVERTLTVHLTDENEAPTDIALSSNSVSEHAAVGAVIGQLSAVDADANDTTTFTLVAGVGDEDNAAFTIEDDQLKTAVPLDFETQSTYHIRVRATDAGGLSVERSFTIEVLDEANEAPTDILLSSNIVLENSTVGTTVGSLTSVDPNLGDTATFSLVAGAGGDDNASFTIEGEELKTAATLDFETQSTYHIRVRATDSGGLSVEREFVIDVANENEAPTTIALSADSVTENVAVGTVIGQLTVSDPDSGDTATFTLVAGAGDEDNAAFAIDADQLKTAVPLDFETQSVYHLRVQATDAGGLSVERTLTIHLTDENEAPTDMALSSNSVSEHAAVGTVIGQLSAIDADANDSATFTLVAGVGDEDNAAFTIEDDQLKTAVPLDFETQSTYHLRVRATDAGGLSVERSFTIEVLDEANEAPTDILLSSNIVLENSTVGTTVGSLTSVDPNLGDTATFSLVAGAGGEDNASFTIEGEELKTATPLDFEAQSTYHIRVRATDSGGLSVEREFVIDVANENEAPTTIALSADSVTENVAVGTVIGQLTESDPDSGDTATFTLVSGAGDEDNAAFAIDADQLKTAVPLDFETQSVYHLRVQATDAGGLSVERNFVITIVNVNEAPVNQLPSGQSINMNQPLSFSAAGGNAILVSDVDAGTDPIRVRLIPLHGTVNIDEFFGNVDEVNALLDGVIFTPDADFQGEALLQVITNDLGHNGVGDELTDLDELTIVVN